MSMRQSEHVLYITLIDFLFQLLFLAIVVGVIYSITIRNKDDAHIDSAKKLDHVQRLTGISNYQELTDLLTKLGPLQPAYYNASVGSKLKDEVAVLGGVEAAHKVLSDNIKKRGDGFPNCIHKSKDSNGFLFEANAYLEKIEIYNHVDGYYGLLNERGGTFTLTYPQFQTFFSPILKSYRDCRFRVLVHEHHQSTIPRRYIESIFYARWLY